MDIGVGFFAHWSESWVLAIGIPFKLTNMVLYRSCARYVRVLPGIAVLIDLSIELGEPFVLCFRIVPESLSMGWNKVLALRLAPFRYVHRRLINAESPVHMLSTDVARRLEYFSLYSSPAFSES